MQIERLAQQLRGEHGLNGKPLGPERFHITLHFLGDYAGLPQDVVGAAVAAAATVRMPPFEVTLDRAMSFSVRRDNRPLILAGGDGLIRLRDLRRALVEALDKARVAGTDTASPYVPHVTLLYDDALVSERTVEPVTWAVRDFALVLSLLGRSMHTPIARWPLVP